MTSDPIYDKLELSPLNRSIELVPIGKTLGDSIEDDLDDVRANIQNLITHGEAALQELKDISSSSQDPKAYREFSVLTKVLLDANKQLLEAAKARSDLKNPDKKLSDDAKNITNNLYVGSTAEAVEMMKNNK